MLRNTHDAQRPTRARSGAPRRFPLLLGLALALLVVPSLARAVQPGDVTPIHEVQGAGPESELSDEVVTIEGVVTGDYRADNALRGFFVQEEADDADADAATSEGIFVFHDSASVAEGDLVRITGTVNELAGVTQLTHVSDVSVISLDALADVALAQVDLPVPDSLTPDAFWEQYEGMLVFFSDALAVSETYELGRYGRIVLSEGGRPYQFTQVNSPDADFDAWLDDLSRRVIYLDDFNNQQNRADVIYHPQPGGLSPTSSFRSGDTLDGLVGIVNYAADVWRIEPLAARPVRFNADNSRPNPPRVRGDVQVATFNVLNYFNGDGSGGGFPTSRGADSPTEFEVQREKIVSALTLLNADVVALMEIENDGGANQATADLVSALNAAQDNISDHYAFIDTGVIGTDAIKVALIYRPAVVTPVGDYAVLDSSIDPDFNTQRNRPALAQTFAADVGGDRFTVVANHLKSKGSGCPTGDNDPVQGSCNGTRTRAAEALIRWLATDPTGSGDPDVLIVGDLNAYAMEDPVTTLLDSGYVNPADPTAYSYVFDGQLGTLDYVLVSASLAERVTGADIWHVNADEIPLLDYNDTVLDESEPDYEAKPHPLTAAGPWRASDHDPVIVGLALAG